MTLPSYFAELIATVLGVGSTGGLGTTVEFWRSLQPKGGCDAEAKQSPGLDGGRRPHARPRGARLHLALSGPRHRALGTPERRSGAPEARAPGGRAGTAPRPSEQVRRRRPTPGRGPARGLAVTFRGKLLELVVLFQETQVDRLLLLGHGAAPSSAALRAAAKLGASVLARRRDGPRRRNHRD